LKNKGKNEKMILPSIGDQPKGKPIREENLIKSRGCRFFDRQNRWLGKLAYSSVSEFFFLLRGAPRGM
jgi:hypothetical protein